jgi:hypothetical protein
LRVDVRQSPEQARLEEIVLGYAGRMTLAVDFEHGADPTDDPRVVGVVEFAADGTTDFAELERLAERHALDSGDTITDLRVGEHVLRAVVARDGGGVVLPKVIDSRLCVFFGQPLEGAVARRLQQPEDAGMGVVAGFAEQGIAVRFDVEKLLRLVSATLAAEGEERFDAILGLLRCDGLQTLSLRGRPAGPHVKLELEMTSDPTRPSLLDVVRPESDRRPELLDFVPRSHTGWSLGFVRLGELYRIVGDLLELPESRIRMTEVEQWFQDSLGIGLAADLVDPLTSEPAILSPSEPSRDADPDSLAASVGGTVVALRVKDPQRFGEAIETMLRKRGLHAARKTKEYRGFQVRTLPLAGFVELNYSIAGSVVVIGLGAGSVAVLREVLDGVAARQAGEEPAALPSHVSERLQGVGEWQGLSVGDLASGLAQVADSLPAACTSPGAPAWMAIAARVVEAFRLGDLARLLRAHGLAEIVSVSAFPKGGVRVRYIW